MFKDLFSVQANDYALYRPKYPPELFAYLATLGSHSVCWDVGTGNGQAAVELAKTFEKVIATDPSEKQIQEATVHPRIDYRVEKAESPSFREKVDLITVAQAFHWFKHAEFADVVKKVAAPGAHLAVWSYAKASVDPETDTAVEKLYSGLLENYWEKERRLVEEGYRNIHMPFAEVSPPQFQLSCEWKLSQLLGYFSTWSALNTYLKTNDSSEIEKAFRDISEAWGDANKVKTVNWPLTLRVWKT